MSTIYATRLGFCFQDKYACLLFLKGLISGELRELYTDFPVAGQLSLDIVLKTGSNGRVTKEQSYEVKTGQKFKDDASTHKRSQVRDVIQSFHQFSAGSTNFEGIVTFTSGSGRALQLYTGPARVLKESRILDRTARTAAKELISLLKMDELNTQRDTHNFFKRVRFNELPYTNDEAWTTVDTDIDGHISTIATSLGAEARTFELPNKFLISKLYYTIQQYNGTGENVAEHLIKEVIDFMILRKMLSNYPSPPESPTQLREQALAQIRRDMISNYKVEDLMPPPETVPASDLAVGGEINV